MANVIRNIPRPPQEIVRRFAEFDPATILEAVGKEGMLDPAIRPIWPGAKVCGVALTVECCPGDNLMLHKAVTVAQPGDILVATTGSFVRAGAWGEVLTVAAQARGIGGLVIDGAARDVEAIAQLEFPVFSRALAIGSCTKSEIGTVNHPINCGGLRIHPGDIVVGDGDGIVIVAREQAGKVLEAATKRHNTERELMARLRQGRTTLELLGLEEVLRRQGLTEE